MMKKNVWIIGVCAIMSLMGCTQHDKNNLNKSASVNLFDELPVNPLLEKVITTTIHPANHTMSTLYANDIAWQYALLNNEVNYPAGSKIVPCNLASKV